ncbi:hypothetical protein ACJ41O_012509 [Fusarium nematophilum]
MHRRGLPSRDLRPYQPDMHLHQRAVSTGHDGLLSRELHNTRGFEYVADWSTRDLTTHLLTANIDWKPPTVVQNASMTPCGVPARDRSASDVVSSATLACIAATFVVTRFAYKIFMTALGLGLDDWLVLATMITVVPSTVITIYGATANGLGRDIWTLAADQITNTLQYLWIIAVIYFIQSSMVKLCIIAFFLRIFPSQTVRRILWVTFTITILWGLSGILLSIFQCKPTSYFWTQWDGLHEGSCIGFSGALWPNAILTIVLDLWILAVPMWQLRALNLHWKKKIGVAVMFCVGTLVTIVSILRLQALVGFGKSTNPTWDLWELTIWSTTEICVGIMCACLPAIRLLLVKLWPILGTSVRSNGNHYEQQGSNSRSSARRARIHDIELVVPDGPNSEQDNDVAAIYLQKTPTVHYSDNDEISLVNRADLPARGK